MKGIVLGILIGLVVGTLPNWLRDYEILNEYPYIVLYLAIFLILLMIFQYPIMRWMARVNPRLYLRLNEFFKPAVIDREFHDKLAKWEEKHRKSKGSDSE